MKMDWLYSYLHSETIGVSTSHHRTLPFTNLRWGSGDTGATEALGSKTEIDG